MVCPGIISIRHQRHKLLPGPLPLDFQRDCAIRVIINSSKSSNSSNKGCINNRVIRLCRATTSRNPSTVASTKIWVTTTRTTLKQRPCSKSSSRGSVPGGGLMNVFNTNTSKLKKPSKGFSSFCLIMSSQLNSAALIHPRKRGRQRRLSQRTARIR